jgi:hypothetical protein
MIKVAFKLQKTRVIVEGEVTLIEDGQTLLNLKQGESIFSLEDFVNANGAKLSSRTNCRAIASTNVRIYSSPYRLQNRDPQVLI